MVFRTWPHNLCVVSMYEPLSFLWSIESKISANYGLLIRYCMVLQKTGQGCQCQLWIQVLLFFFLLLLFASQALEILCRPRIVSSSNGLYQSLTGRCKNFFSPAFTSFLVVMVVIVYDIYVSCHGHVS